MKILLLPLAFASAQVIFQRETFGGNSANLILVQDMSAFSCGDTTSASQFYFVSPAYPVSIILVKIKTYFNVDRIKSSQKAVNDAQNVGLEI